MIDVLINTAMVLACIALLIVIPAAVSLLLVIWRDLQG